MFLIVLLSKLGFLYICFRMCLSSVSCKDVLPYWWFSYPVKNLQFYHVFGQVIAIFHFAQIWTSDNFPLGKYNHSQGTNIALVLDVYRILLTERHGVMIVNSKQP